MLAVLVRSGLTYLLLGLVYFEMGRIEEAAEQFDLLHNPLPSHVLDVVNERLPYSDGEPKKRMHKTLTQVSKSG